MIKKTSKGIPVGAQFVGLSAALAGLHMLTGTAVTLVVGGVVVAVLGALKEAGRL